MRAVLVAPFAVRPKGTVKARILPLAQALSARGHRLLVVVPPWDWPNDSGTSYTTDGVEIVNLRLGPRLPILFHLVLLLRLLQLTHRQNPDVVHVFKPKGYSGVIGMLFRLLRAFGRTHARVVVDTDDWEGRGGWNDIGGYSWLLRLVFPLQEKWTLRCADAVTTASRALQQMVVQLGVPACRTFYVPNGPSEIAAEWLEKTDDLPSTTPPARNTLLLYTRFMEFQPARVADLICRVRERVADVELLVVGAGLHGEERRFLQTMADAGLSQNVHMLGWVDGDELASHMTSAKVAIYPYEDNLVNRTKCSAKLVELLSRGVVVVADRVGENAAYIEDGVSGRLVEPGDTAAFAGAVIELLQDEETRRCLGQNARRRIKDKFQWPGLAEQAEAAYGGLGRS